MSTKKIATVGILCSLGIVVSMFIKFPLVPAVGFLTYEPKDILIIIGGFIYGPLTALVMSVICSLIELLYNNAGGNVFIDMLMNVISTCGIAVVSAYIYKKDHTRKGAIKGLVIGIITTVVLMTLWNYVVTPGYYGMPRAAIVALLPWIALFNVLKGSINSLVVVYLYKPLTNILKLNHLVHTQDKTTRRGIVMTIGFILITLILVVLAIKGII